MSRIGDRLKAHWSARGVEPPPGVPECRLRDFEGRYGVNLPADLRGYLLDVDGMDSRGESDSDWFSFWPLASFVPASEHYPDDRIVEDQPSYFVFADHSIELPAYAIRLTPSEQGPHPVIAVAGHTGDFSISIVARSFGEFVERYLADETSRGYLSIGVPAEI